MPEDSKIEESPGNDSSLMEEITDPEISTKSAATDVYIPHILFQEAATKPTKLQEHFETDELDNVVQNKSEFDDSHGQILSTQTILDTGQAIDKQSFGC
ncbi:receptor-like protein 12 [Pyrus ussuriensis x Pyrus communis]|uniref:Receptor-like protein 12 n=1 Tax=Pyrus ussuriensis x Pyrus communis TaxID=2448454 RepID=A0A5N5GS15_9ROSA|nr:receptor-like protein 12 [Pyrus ussuriensis x Pyrus communis]